MADMTAEQLAVYRAWASSGPKSCATPAQENEVQRGLLCALEAAEAQIAALTARLSGIDQLLADREVAVAQAVEFAEYVERAAKGAMVERAKHFLSAPYAAELRARLSGMAAAAPTAVHQWSASQLIEPVWHDATAAEVQRMQEGSAAALFTFRTLYVDHGCASGDWIAAADVKRLARELDVAWNGEDGAAAAPALCDVVAQIVRELPPIMADLQQFRGLPATALPDAAEIVGHKTFANDDGTFRHEPVTAAEAAAIFAEADRQKERRAALMPNEETAVRWMCQAHQRLQELGWRDAIYCPKDRSPFLAIEPGSSGFHHCHYEGSWPNGSWWGTDVGDSWPSRPFLFKPLPVSPEVPGHD